MESLSPFLQGSFIPCFMPVYPGAPQKSTGPVTPEGKARSSLNALKSGIDAWSHIIPGEDPAQLEALTEQFLLHYQPADPIQLWKERLASGVFSASALSGAISPSSSDFRLSPVAELDP